MRETTKLKRYIKEVRRIGMQDAANQIGIQRTYLSAIANGRPAGKKTARKIESWSSGWVSAQEIIFPKEN